MNAAPNSPTLIIGGGISGLYAASLLRDRGEPFLLLEARPQAGGRIRTLRREGHAFDLGPSWFWPDLNPRMSRLVERLALPHYPQHTSGDALIDDPAQQLRREPHALVDPRHARRLAGGTQSLVDALLATLPADRILTNHRVSSIADNDDHCSVTARSAECEQTFHARDIILALPPRLLADTLSFHPELPASLLSAFRNIPTWMAGDAKFFALYDESFWRADGLSGSAYSESGPLSESHDATLPDGPAALLGFLIPGAQERAARGESLVPQCLAQLARYFGPRAASPRDTILMDWSNEPLTATAADLPLTVHPAYGLPAEASGLWNHRLNFAGTEAGPEHGGYLEGALEAAEQAVASTLT